MNIRFIRYCSVLALVTMLFACSDTAAPLPDAEDEAVVSAGGRILYKSELNELISNELNSADSTLAAEAYIKMWIKNQLMYEKAQENLLDKVQIDELVDNYRQSLTIYTYQEQLLKERLSKEIAEQDMHDYYDNYPDKFKLETNIIKGLFLKVPVSSPRLEDLRKWYLSTSEKSIENIEKYSLENAVIYDYFYDKWVDFDDVMNNIPKEIENQSQFLKDNKRLEVQDSMYVYLLNIKEYMLIGNNSPFEFAKGEVFEILVSQRRESFIKKIEDDLYKDAIAHDQIRFYTK